MHPGHAASTGRVAATATSAASACSACTGQNRSIMRPSQLCRRRSIGRLVLIWFQMLNALREPVAYHFRVPVRDVWSAHTQSSPQVATLRFVALFGPDFELRCRRHLVGLRGLALRRRNFPADFPSLSQISLTSPCRIGRGRSTTRVRPAISYIRRRAASWSSSFIPRCRKTLPRIAGFRSTKYAHVHREAIKLTLQCRCRRRCSHSSIAGSTTSFSVTGSTRED